MSEGIFYNKDGSLNALVGKDAVHLMRVRTIISGIKMNVATNGRMQITSSAKGGGIRNLLGMASEYTGKRYTTGQKSKEAAVADLEVWFQEMKSALPQEVRK